MHYSFRVAWSPEDEEFVGRCLEFPSLSWLGGTVHEAFDGIVRLVADTVDDLERSGEVIPEPFADRTFSGRFALRMSPVLHRRLAMEAAEHGVSINKWVNEKLADA
ncbi:type II toxin-antitoxin system HicB family antitoxin [Nocardia blacklockiae]|nr:type II toxin-antitoxin system HicB family antitoxin [Nocardia blacklockiae]